MPDGVTSGRASARGLAWLPQAHGHWSKRSIDIALGTILAIVALPAIVLLALGSALTLRTNPFFVQQRVGRNGRLIPILKLRTLPRTVPNSATKYALVDVVVPRFSQRLRTSHLDELPQLLLVPIGYLSLVGPRPEMVRLHDEGDPGFGAERTQLRPGCTGLWQVSDAAAGLIWEAPQYDLHYIRNCSLALDLWIMWRTVLTLAGRATPVELSRVPASRSRGPAAARLTA
jgi:lipopolysaccharide/colanic/teichoic acid biosynthesis glycosyltransferase